MAKPDLTQFVLQAFALVKPETEFPWMEKKSVVEFDRSHPGEFTVDTELLTARRAQFYDDARNLLWDPLDTKSSGLFSVGFEAAQFPEELSDLFEIARKIGARVIQPTVRATHYNLTLAATDLKYCAWLRAMSIKSGVAVISVSAHVLFYAILSLKYNSMAMRWVPDHCKKATVEETIEALWNELILLLLGAAQLGIEVIHLFFGKPSSIGDYPWDPFEVEHVQAMDAIAIEMLNKLGFICIRLGIKLAHEIHPRTMARNMRDFARIWKQLDPRVRQVIGLGFDPSHFWDGEEWYMAILMAMELGIPMFIAHAKNMVRRPGLAAHGHDPQYYRRGHAFCHLDDVAGMVSMHQYFEYLQYALVPFWLARKLPTPVHCEAEVQGRRQFEVTERAVTYLQETVIGPSGWHPAKADFTAAMG